MKLYTIVEAVPSRILGVIHVLQAAKRRGRTRAEVLDLLQPPSIRKGAEADMTSKVLSAAIELGVIEEHDDERGEKCIRLSELAAPVSAVSPEPWIRWLARRVLHDLANGVSRDLATIFSWMMTIPVNDTPNDETSWKQRFRSDGFDVDGFQLNSDARWHNVFYWAKFFGLAWQTSNGKATGIVCDPSVLVARFLDDILQPGQEMTAAVFRERMGSLFPPLDGGILHRDVRDRVAKARSESTDREDRFSPAVSMALRELRDRAKLAYHCPDDQRTFLLLNDGEKIAFVSRPAPSAP